MYSRFSPIFIAQDYYIFYETLIEHGFLKKYQCQDSWENGFFGQVWPFSEINLITYCAICWNSLFNGITTSNVSGTILFIGSLTSKKVVSKTQSAGNQRRFISSLVGTSETTRAAICSNSFGQWLAGVIDGNGNLLVNKQGYTSLEITMPLEDLPLLRYIQNMLGGSIKIRSGAKAYRYRLHNKLSMINLVNYINGNSRHSSRLIQLHRVCQQLTIPVISPVDFSSSWFAGFFDANGTIGFYMKNGTPQLIISVTSRLMQDVQYYTDLFGGYIYFDSSQNGYYK